MPITENKHHLPVAHQWTVGMVYMGADERFFRVTKLELSSNPFVDHQMECEPITPFRGRKVTGVWGE